MNGKEKKGTMYVRMFVAKLFIVAKEDLQQPKHPSIRTSQAKYSTNKG